MLIKRNLTAALTFVATLLVASSAFADGGAADNTNSVAVALALSAGLGLGIAAIGGALAQGKAAAAALEGIGRNPAAAKELFTPLLLSLALIESLVIYSLVIAFILSGKIDALAK
jgi:F-type H+-transporting ATPase subunit c